MKCSDCPYADNSQICHIKCDHKQEKSKKVKSPYQIPKVSKKRQIQDLEYKILREEFLSRKENQICPISKQQTVEVHLMGVFRPLGGQLVCQPFGLLSL